MDLHADDECMLVYRFVSFCEVDLFFSRKHPGKKISSPLFPLLVCVQMCVSVCFDPFCSSLNFSETDSKAELLNYLSLLYLLPRKHH